MSLRVWLPLTKDLRQQGLSDMTVTNNGATFDSSGKLGGCYSFNGSSNYVTLPQGYINNNWSYALWVYTSASTTQTLGCCRTAVGTGFSIFLSNTGKIRIDAGISSTSSQWTVNYTFPINTWFHLVITANNNEIKYYINGNYQETHTVSTAVNQWGNIFSIGASQANGSNYGNYLKGKLNDIRIYDHCLSPMEVKELSQGLILHYPLNRQGFGQENLFKNSSLTDLTSDNLSSKIYYQGSYIPEITSNGIKFTWTDSSAREIDLWLDTNLKADTYYTLSFVYRNNMAINSSFYLRNNSSLVGYWSQSTIPYSENWAKYSCTFKIANYQTNDATTGTLLTLFYSGYTANKWIELKQNSIKLEEGSLVTPWCPANTDELTTIMDLNSTTEYDCSGFCNNLNKNGSYSYSSDTPKYAVSTKFNGTEWMNGTNSGAEIMTLACWAKTTKNKSTSQFMVADYMSNMCISFYSNCIIGVFGSTRSTGSKSTLGSSYKENDWNHFVVVKTGTAGERAIYCNGELLTPTSNDYWGSASGFFIGSRNNSGALPFYGQICDVRAYATALSAEDVKSLYQNSAYIDSSGNVYGAIHTEV